MYRKFYEVLKKWEEDKVQEPLLVIGAIQVGKTWLIKQFCEDTYKDYIYINLEERKDIITIIDEKVIPIEIKSGRHKKSTSLNNYVEKYKPEYVIRISESNFGMANNIKSVPLYASFCI